MDVIYDHDSYFVQHKDMHGRSSISALQKCITALKMLAYGIVVDATNE